MLETIGNTMKFKISSPYGAVDSIRDNIPHHGIDIAIPSGMDLHSIVAGVVEKVTHGGKLGNGVIIRNPSDNNYYIWGHMSKVDVTPGQHINIGDLIGQSGATGNVTGAHLHFAVQSANGNWIDPTVLVPQVMDGAGAAHASIGHDLVGWWNHLGDKVIGAENHLFWQPLLNSIGHEITELGHWFILNLPDLMGYVTIGAGIMIILSSMTGKGGMIKTLGWYFGAFIIAALILGGV